MTEFRARLKHNRFDNFDSKHVNTFLLRGNIPSHIHCYTTKDKAIFFYSTKKWTIVCVLSKNTKNLHGKVHAVQSWITCCLCYINCTLVCTYVRVQRPRKVNACVRSFTWPKWKVSYIFKSSGTRAGSNFPRDFPNYDAPFGRGRARVYTRNHNGNVYFRSA